MSRLNRLTRFYIQVNILNDVMCEVLRSSLTDKYLGKKLRLVMTSITNVICVMKIMLFETKTPFYVIKIIYDSAFMIKGVLFCLYIFKSY